MDYNETICKAWSKEDWFDHWCSGPSKNIVPPENLFGEDDYGNGFTLKQACNETCNTRRFSLIHIGKICFI